MSEQNAQNTAENIATQQYTLDGSPITLVELNEAKNKNGIKIKEESPGVYKTLQRLNG